MVSQPCYLRWDKKTKVLKAYISPYFVNYGDKNKYNT